MIAYLETSAAAKLLVHEAQSDALARHLDAAAARGDRVVSCVLLETELRRFAGRVGLDQSVVTTVLDTLDLAELERAQYRLAGLLPGTYLRSLDALHVASALRLEADEMVTYDDRQAAAARAAGIAIRAPA